VEVFLHMIGMRAMDILNMHTLKLQDYKINKGLDVVNLNLPRPRGIK
jgi:hypothetical protein